MSHPSSESDNGNDDLITRLRSAPLRDDDSDEMDVLFSRSEALYKRFGCTGQLRDIEEAITSQRDLVSQTSTVRHRAQHQYILASYYHARFERFRDDFAIVQAIEVLLDAIRCANIGLLDRRKYIENLKAYYNEYQQRTGKRFYALETRIKRFDLMHVDDTLNELRQDAESAHVRFTQSGSPDDIDEGIRAMRRAVELTPNDHPDKALNATILGDFLLGRSERLGEVSDVEEAIKLHRRVVAETPDDHPHKPLLLAGLGLSCEARFGHIGDAIDIEESIRALRRAVELVPDNHADMPQYLHALGATLFTHFRHTGQRSDIEETVKVYRDLLERVPDGHPYMADYLGALGSSLAQCFNLSHEITNIEEAVTLHSRAVEIIPDDHSEQPLALNDLAVTFATRFHHLREDSDLHESIRKQRQAVKLLPEGHPRKSGFMINLGMSLEKLLAVSSPPVQSDFMDAEDAYRRACDAGPPSVSLKAAASCTHLYAQYPSFVESPQRVIEMHKRVMELVPEVVWLGHSISRRFEEISKYGDVVRAAVAAALSFGEKTMALEWFEEGRAIVWSQIRGLRAPVDELRDSNSQLAEDLQRTAAALERAGQRKTSTIDLGLKSDREASLEDEAVNHRSLARKFRRLLDDIRQLKGFENFLRPRKVRELAQAVDSNGLVVCINVDESRCDALILHKAGSETPIVHHVPLPKITSKDAKNLRDSLETCLQRVRPRKILLDYNYLQDSDNENLHTIFSTLWNCVVHPIIDVIKSNIQHEGLLRITWCTSGALAFLPLHAAGIYESDTSLKACDIIISSYTPTLASLLASASTDDISRDPRVLILSQPSTPRKCPLPGTVREAKIVEEAIGRHESCLVLNGHQGTVKAVLDGMDDHPWIHLACHAEQNVKDPTQSAFLLHDGRLTLQQLMVKTASTGLFAFLSACETAMGDEKVPDEAVHLAAGMLAAGYRSVVATMWSIGDSEGPQVAEVFYKELLENRKVTGKMDVPYALHAAVKALREKVGAEDFVKWVPFVHFGV